jgi:hypothetical protein
MFHRQLVQVVERNGILAGLSQAIGVRKEQERLPLIPLGIWQMTRGKQTKHFSISRLYSIGTSYQLSVTLSAKRHIQNRRNAQGQRDHRNIGEHDPTPMANTDKSSHDNKAATVRGTKDP